MGNEDKVKRIAELILLVLATVIVVGALSVELISNSTIAKSAAQIDVDRCELMIRINESLISAGNLLIGPKAMEARGQGSKQLAQQSLPLLVSAHQQNPNDPIVLAKALIVSDYLGGSDHQSLVDLQSMTSQKAKQLAHMLALVYGKGDILSQDVQSISLSIDKLLPPSWYRDHLHLKLYQKGKAEPLYLQLQERLTERSFALFGRILAITLFGTLLLLVGFAILLGQLFKSPKPLTSQQELSEIRAPADYGPLRVYAVFIAWLATQVAIGVLAHPFVKGLIGGRLSITGTAALISAIYVLSNGPGLLYIYLFALRPHHLNFLKALKIRWRYASLSAGRMILAGVLTWVAAMPLMAFAYYVSAQFFGSRGSSNPMIAIVTEAARHENLSATLLFYVTLGVLAPICEESLFRGFLYTYLRRFWGVFPTVVTSAAFFSFAHLDPGGFLPLFCLGCAFALVVEKTKSIIPAMIAHGLWNSCTFTLVIFLFGS